MENPNGIIRPTASSSREQLTYGVSECVRDSVVTQGGASVAAATKLINEWGNKTPQILMRGEIKYKQWLTLLYLLGNSGMSN